MKCFITGANGFIGSRLAEKLTAEGHQVTCLVRSPEKALIFNGWSPRHIIGDLHDTGTLMRGMEGCDHVFHLAAYARPWSKDKSLPYKINVDGTVNVLEAALRAGVSKVVVTSSAAVTGPSGDRGFVNEDSVRIAPFFNEYEETKALAETRVKEYAVKGLHAVIVNPTRVFGPGPLNQSNSVTKMLRGYYRGTWHIMPGDGCKTGNYVYIDDVVNGHILAALNGISGEKYILGGENVSFRQLFEKFAAATGRRRLLVPLPVGIMIGIANFLEFQYKITSIPPPITAPWVNKYLENWNLSSEKAVRQLGYSITPLDQAIGQTLLWLKNSKP